MQSRALWVCCVMLYLASTAGRASAQDRAVTPIKGDEDRIVEDESARVEGAEAEEPIELVPLPPGTVFQRHTVAAEGADVTAGATEQLIFSNTLGRFGAALGANRLVADDITTTVPNNCKLRRIEFPVMGKVNSAGVRGSYWVEFAMYKSCPGSVPTTSLPDLIIPGTFNHIDIPDECLNTTDEDGDSTVNDGCSAVGPAETGAQCLNAIDDDGDAKVNDGCPAVGATESDADAPRLISIVTAANVPLPTNFWFGVKFSRSNAGPVAGTPPLSGFSCDQNDYPGFPCNNFFGGFPLQPQASFNLEIYADSACANSFTGYKNHRPSGSTYSPGQNIYFADDIHLSSSTCSLVGYSVAVKGQGSYDFEIRNNCESGLIPGTQGNFIIGSGTDKTIANFTFAQPILLPQNFWFVVKVNNPTAKVVISGQQACIGSTANRIDLIGENGCTILPPNVLGAGVHGAFDLAITCAGAAPVGACCDMYITDENGDAVCREVPQTNCPFPPRFTADRPEWVQVEPNCDGGPHDGLPCEVDSDCQPDGQCTRCAPDPWVELENREDRACGKAACCKPDGSCQNLTRNECYAVPPLESERQWQLGKYCTSQGQRCPRIACLARTGECTNPRCLPQGGACNFTTHLCSAGNIGHACSNNTQCHCTGGICQIGPTCCDSCPPIGCGDADCCTKVCDLDSYCCDTEWDQFCADKARENCNIIPANDECAPDGNAEGARGARLITDVPPSSVESDSGRATTDATDPGFGCFVNDAGAAGLQTVWYKFVATNTSALLQTCNSNSPADDSLLGVFAVGDPTSPGTQCNTLIPIACSDDFQGCSDTGRNSKLCVKSLIPGNMYYVMVASKEALEPGKAYRLDISTQCTNPPPPPVGVPANDFCPAAIPILDGTTPFDLAHATMDPPVESCIGSMIDDIWFNYTATCTGLLTVETCGASGQTNLAIYDECKCPISSGIGDPLDCNFEGVNCELGSKLSIDATEATCYKIRLADSGENRPSGNLKISCVQANCPAGQFTFTDPPNGVVDAGRPHDPNNAAVLQGIQTIKATGPRDARASCFTLCETPNGGSPNSVGSVVEAPDETYTITLTRPITGGALTTITYKDTHDVLSTGRFTSHPGNVKADATTSAVDVNDLLAILNGTSQLIWGNYSGDINRSGRITPADVLEEIDLMTDDGLYDPPLGGWDGTPNQSDSEVCP